MNLTMTPCAKFNPLLTDAAFCTCQLHWKQHVQAAQAKFWDDADKALIDKVVSACKRDNVAPCKKYTPSKDWAQGEGAPDCVCGRPTRPSHLPGDILDGIRLWKETHPRVVASKPICGHFHSILTTPGQCVVCDRKWIDHAPLGRGLVIEAFYDQHEDSCKCVIMNGDVQCSCMSDEEIQKALDKLGGSSPAPKKELSKMGCQQFKPKSPGVTHCHCGTPFHLHTTVATDGHASFLSWRASHMSNRELLVWFHLLGKTRSDRTDTLKRIVADPHFTFVPPANMINPDNLTMLALLDTLTGTHYIQSPTDIEKIEAKRRGDSLDDLKLDEDDFFHNCYACGEQKSMVKGQKCDSCEAIFHPKVAHTSGEVLSD